MLWRFSSTLGKYGVDSALKWYPPPPPDFYTREFTSQDMPILCRTISHIAKEYNIEEKAREICCEVRGQLVWLLKDTPKCECMAQEPPESKEFYQSTLATSDRKKDKIKIKSN